MKHQTHLKAWLLLMFFGLLLVPVFIHQEMAQARITEEISSIQSIFGEDASDVVITRANSAYQIFCVQSGLVGFAERRIVTSQQDEESRRVLGKGPSLSYSLTNSYLLGLIANIYGFFFRFNLLLIWLPLSIPFMGGVLIDAFVARKLKAMTFSYFSPAAFQAASHLMIFTMMLPLCYLIIPITMSPLWVPAIVMVMSAGLRFSILNMQRMLS